MAKENKGLLWMGIAMGGIAVGAALIWKPEWARRAREVSEEFMGQLSTDWGVEGMDASQSFTELASPKRVPSNEMVEDDGTKEDDNMFIVKAGSGS
ncbi:hypothetical protein [Marininema halotolerans]|uniref:Uncharacterized protein n=1 Tax=Marininema halotolerans TaxID=1155944 RepID=A0A1I6RN45_9BACL|nr:hypothetical protein [Marininema halotolerans]SFS66084.1 hypothetical protein SAMN05444972_105223 [Marininema halotolerans]